MRRALALLLSVPLLLLSAIPVAAQGPTREASPLPDLIVIDGGKGRRARARADRKAARVKDNPRPTEDAPHPRGDQIRAA